MAENKRDYYEVLGVSKDADESALKKAGLTLAKRREKNGWVALEAAL